MRQTININRNRVLIVIITFSRFIIKLETGFLTLATTKYMILINRVSKTSIVSHRNNKIEG